MGPVMISLFVHSIGDLFQMMAAVDLMKAPPLLRRERAEDGMIEHASPGAKALFCVGQRGVHGN